MRNLWSLVLILGLFLGGCAGVSGPAAKDEARQVVAEDGQFYVYAYAGRHYVLGSRESAKKFTENKVVAYTKTILGAGPHGETVVFEVNKKDQADTERLIETYQKTPFLVAEQGDNYAVFKYNSRIYVIGNAKTRAAFEKHPHLPYTKTLLGAGPGGETVIFEVDKKHPETTEKLIKMYRG